MERSRYIKKTVDNAIKQETGFRCAWCGEYLTIRHHIIEFSLGGPNSEDNLILLCPNCHDNVHSGKISQEELEKIKSELTGQIDRSAGVFSINKEYFQIDIGGFHAINCKNVLLFNNIPLISVKKR